ncbi:unnamed protein product [Thlaspi arvense]|uniref:DUF642 domain-containing protein n=1 Tax=Thlaspi arvense TaxID=13288 RepID=A0AAU9R8T5_THLAR|nr:unnamed protein product [Thlaspi arvense]
MASLTMESSRRPIRQRRRDQPGSDGGERLRLLRHVQRRSCAQLESINVSVDEILASRNVDLQTLYSVQGWDPYAWAFEAEEDHVRLIFKNPGMEDDPTCGPIIDDIAIKKLFTPES